MSFTWKYNLNDFLLENFNINTVTTCVLVTFGVFIAALIVESAKYLDLYLNKKFKSQDANGINKKKLQLLIIKTLLRMFSLALAYIVMLISMNYYSGHFIAIVIGFGVGHYLLNSTESSVEFLSNGNSISKKAFKENFSNKNYNFDLKLDEI